MSASHHGAWQRRLGWLVFWLWAMAFAGSFASLALALPEDFIFTAGSNRVLAFIGWQVAASALALTGLVIRGGLPRHILLRRLLMIPVALFLAMGLAIGLLIVWANSGPPG